MKGANIMEIPIGARIDRKTGVITPLYKEGTQDDMKTLASMLIKVWEGLSLRALRGAIHLR